MGNDNPPSSGMSRHHPSSGGSQAIGHDERAVLDAMRAVESGQRPGLLTLYYNGSNWLLYEAPRPKYLRNG